MSSPLEEDVDASQVRTFLEGTICMLIAIARYLYTVR